MIRNAPYWWDAAPPVTLPQTNVPSAADVVIVGAGYTGLSAGLTLARAGRKVLIFDRMKPGEGASTRNGGIASGNLRPGHAELARKFGQARADALLLEGKAAREDLATFGEGMKYDHKDAEGFIRLFSLPERVRAITREGRGK